MYKRQRETKNTALTPTLSLRERGNISHYKSNSTLRNKYVDYLPKKLQKSSF